MVLLHPHLYAWHDYCYGTHTSIYIIIYTYTTPARICTSLIVSHSLCSLINEMCSAFTLNLNTENIIHHNSSTVQHLFSKSNLINAFTIIHYIYTTPARICTSLIVSHSLCSLINEMCSAFTLNLNTENIIHHNSSTVQHLFSKSNLINAFTIIHYIFTFRIISIDIINFAIITNSENFSIFIN